jgi:phosphoribosyl-ATP pyrophosphohydrolase
MKDDHMEATLRQLTAAIKEKKHGDPTQSYIAKRFASGRAKIAQKVGEEGVELAIALVLDDKADIVSEATDLLFHLMIGLEDAGLSLDDVMQELQRREGMSGLEEKRQRVPT